MAWYHAQFTSRRFGQFTPNPPPPDSLFGPNIGPVQQGPAWTTHTQPKRLVDPDELTTDTVRSWIEKSKIPTTPTTTLQALVNLRRPTLRLSPLAPADGVTMKDAPHLLEFQFDCAAPKCGVHVHVLLPPAHPDAPAHGGALRVFESVVEGGFARALGPADAAVIELARFERTPPPSAPAATASTPSAPAASAPAAPERKRFTPFHFRRRNASANAPAAAATPVAGAALAVVEGDGKKEEDGGDVDDEKGVRVTIRLVALDAAGRELDSPNEQTVYLVVGRLGAAPTATPPAASTSDATAAPSADDATKEKEGDNKEVEADVDTDTRPWLVRVVKREATIGPHTFQLHEIYGLSSAAAPAPTPAATSPATYPPQPPADDPPERECLLCLSSPREVVLLPCRHLVACRPCAVNMVEFGAGGAIVATEAAEPEPEPEAAAAAPAPAAEAADGTTSPTEGAAPAPEAAADGTAPAAPAPEGDAAAPATTTPAPAAAAPAAPTTTTTTTRRKRKAKGWFCPVCRQPYTSLLRITTAPPPAGAAAAASPASPTSPAAPNTNTATQEESGNGGGLLSGLRPAFLRGLSIRGERAAPRDVEAQV
ncbi:RING-type domain-containing protein [Mycena venus]|uniref:RING-type domain-containing protein n=1 Tax=Mycena venus TaxID=2733690 RepID=A0A8H6YJY7_9AGAR|nr:RING-type domain-containing protein [Mycena venus]